MALFSFVALKTLFLILIWISMGLCLEIFGPTLVDLATRFNTDQASVSRVLSACGIGGCVGGVVAGILADKWPRWLDLMLVTFVTTISVATASVTMATNVDQMWFSCLTLGIGVGGIIIVGQRLIIVMWKERAASPLHALHMGFGIGAVLIPLIADPFLMVTRPLPYNHTGPALAGNTTLTTITSTAVGSSPSSASVNSTQTPAFVKDFFSTNISQFERDFEIVRASNMDYVFYLVGCLGLLSGLPFILYQCLNSDRCNPMFRKVVENEVKKTEKIGFLQMLNPASYAAGSLGFALAMFTLMILYFSGAGGGERLFRTFIRTYSVELLHFPEDSASYLRMIYWVSFTLSRLLGSILSIFIPIKHLIIVQSVLCLGSVTTINIIDMTKTYLWVFTIIQGVLYAPLFPMGVSFVNSVIDVRGFCLTIISLAASLGELGYIWFAGMLYDQIGIHVIAYTMQASVITIFIAVIGFRLVSCGRKPHGAKQYHTVPEKLEKLEMSMKGLKRSEEAAGLLESSEDEL